MIDEKRTAALVARVNTPPIAQIAATLEAGDRCAGLKGGLGISTPEFYVQRAARLHAAAEKHVFSPSAEPE